MSSLGTEGGYTIAIVGEHFGVARRAVVLDGVVYEEATDDDDDDSGALGGGGDDDGEADDGAAADDDDAASRVTVASHGLIYFKVPSS